MKKIQRIQVAAAVIERGGKYLICRRIQTEGSGAGNLWEFPGGKLEPGETLADCLIRECREELSIQVTPGALLDSVEVPGKNGDTYQIHFVEVTGFRGEPTLAVHSECRFVSPEQFGAYSFCPADAVFITRHFISHKEKMTYD